MCKKLLFFLFLVLACVIQAQEKQNLDYLFLSYDLIPDERVKITEDEYKNFIAENEVLIKNAIEGNVKTLQVCFEVPYIEKDSLLIFNKLKEKSNNFANGFSDSASILINGGKSLSLNYNEAKNIRDILQKPIGSLINFTKDNVLNVAKIKNIKTIADSAKVRHILVSDEKLADQLFEDLTKRNKTWDEVNKKYSLDAVSASKGGVIDFFTYGMMVEPFNTFCFSEETKIGTTYKIQTVFGFHLVQVLDRKYVSQNNKTVEMWAFSMPIPIQESEIFKVEKQTNDLLKTNKDFASLSKAVNILGKEFQDINNESFNEIAIGSGGKLPTFPAVIKFENPSNNIVKFYIIDKKNPIIGNNLIDFVKEEYTFYIINMKKSDIFLNELKAYKSLKSLSRKYKTKIKKVTIYADESTHDDFPDIDFSSVTFDAISSFKKGDIFPIDSSNGIYFFEK